MPTLYYSASSLSQTPRESEFPIDESQTVSSAELRTICDPGCPGVGCCVGGLTSACAKRVNTNGMILSTTQNFLLLFGGIDATGFSDINLDCYFLQAASQCLSRATNEAYMISDRGESYLIAIPDGMTKPPRLYGHKMLLVKLAVGLAAYVFGGRSPDVAGGVSNQLWKLMVPYSPMASGEGGNEWEKVELTGCSMPGLFGSSFVASGSVFYVYSGAMSDFTTNRHIYLIDYLAKTCQQVSYQIEKLEFDVRLWDGSLSKSSLPQYDFKGRIQAMTKFEKGIFVVIDGFLLENDQILPLNQLSLMKKNSAGEYFIEQIKFEDELFRQPKQFNPYCFVTYSTNVPQLHLVSFQINGFLEVKQVLIDPTAGEVNTYNEILTFPGTPR